MRSLKSINLAGRRGFPEAMRSALDQDQLAIGVDHGLDFGGDRLAGVLARVRAPPQTA